MNDDTLTIALDRMATALEPPTAANEMIATTRGRIRRRRRVATGLCAASVVGITAATAVLASNLAGTAGPAPEQVPVASTSATPTDTEAEENEKFTHRCDPGGDGALTPAEIEEFEHEVLDETQLSMDVAGRTIHAYVVIPAEGKAVYALKARRAGESVEIVSVTRCD